MQNELYAGKAKTLYTTDDANMLIAEFRDDTSAFDGRKVSQLENKGAINNQFNAYIAEYLHEHGIQTHFVEQYSATASYVKRLEMIPVECVIRNYAAGSFCKRYGTERGQAFATPLFEFFLKNDELHDPMISDSYITAFQLATAEEIAELKVLTYKVNAVLQPLFANADLLLVDFKLEFGRFDGQLVLGDEFTPDGCRIWEQSTRESLDKDRFRQDLGNVIESYQLIAERLGVPLALPSA